MSGGDWSLGLSKRIQRLGQRRRFCLRGGRSHKSRYWQHFGTATVFSTTSTVRTGAGGSGTGLAAQLGMRLGHEAVLQICGKDIELNKCLKVSQKHTHGTYTPPTLGEIDVESREGLSPWWGLVL